MNTYGTKEAAAFLNGTGTDAIGRTIADYLAFDAAKWEECHNHVQWAFPSHIKSSFNLNAPVVDMNDLMVQLTSHGVANVYSLLTNYMHSIGFVMDTERWVLSGAEAGWLTPYNHNFLRISRILNLLSHLSPEDATELLDVFLDVARGHQYTYIDGRPIFDIETVVYWSKAAIGKL